MKLGNFSIVAIGVGLALPLLGWAAEAVAPPPIKAAIFVQNKAASTYDDDVGPLNDMIATRLTEKGFSIIDRAEAVKGFKEGVRTAKVKAAEEAKHKEELKRKGEEAYLKKYGENRDKVTIVAEHKEEAHILDRAGYKDEQKLSIVKEPEPLEPPITMDPEMTLDETIDNISALRIAQMIAPGGCLIFASITSAGTTTDKFSGKNTSYGVDVEVKTYTMRISLKVCEGGEGGSVYGDIVTVAERVPLTGTYSSNSDDITNKLLDQAAEKIAANITGKMERIRNTKVNAVPLVEITARCNIENADLIVDGAVRGSIGPEASRIMVPPGLHTVAVSREWFNPWKRVITIQQGQKIDVQLELSPGGVAKFKTVAEMKQRLELDKKREESEIETEAYRKKKEADAEFERAKHKPADVNVKVENKSLF